MISLFLLNLINHALRSSRILIQSFSIFVIPPTGGSAGKESACNCNAGDPGSIPVSGRDRRRDRLPTPVFMGFPGGSDCKESTCNAGDSSSIPGSGRSPGEGISYPFQYSWASLVAQMVKSPPTMWETWVRSLGWKDPLEKGTATHSSILAWRIPCSVQFMGSQRVGLSFKCFQASVGSKWL